MANFTCHRVVLTEPPFAGFGQDASVRPWNDHPRWPCSWVRPVNLPEGPIVVAYRLQFTLPEPRQFRLHATGDERYELFLNGQRIARGPARAARGQWHYESFDLDLPAGEHLLAARVHSLRKLAPWAQTTFAHGWLLAPEPEDLWDTLGTGRAGWQAKIIPGYRFSSPNEHMPPSTLGCGAMVEISGPAPDWLSADGWGAVKSTFSGNDGFTLYQKDKVPLMFPSPLPAQKSEPHSQWATRDFWSGASDELFPREFDGENTGPALTAASAVSITPNSKQRWLLDFEQYLTAYPRLTTTGGQDAVIRLGWSEALVDADRKKGNRDAVAGRRWRGLADTFRPDGAASRVFEPHWWRCGRYLLLEVETADDPLTFELELEKTGYPLEVTAAWDSGRDDWGEVFELSLTSLQACMHETYMDCPFYEQLQYLGDTRLQMLVTYVLSPDDRLPRQALTAFAAAQKNPTGWMPSNHPSSNGQRIATFPLWWVAMLHDYGMWRGDQPFIKSLLPTARQVVELWLEGLTPQGLVRSPSGWNFVDWVDHLGDASQEFHGVLNWHLVYTLRLLGELESWCGEPELSARAQRLATSIAAACEQFWCVERLVYSDDLDHTLFSEHGNCMALLSNLLPAVRREEVEHALFKDEHLTRCSVYFSHYLFEAAAAAGRMDVIERRLEPWLKLREQGFVSIPETFGDCRSDCHAWGAHPLYHFFTHFAGVRPADWGFAKASVTPSLGSLKQVRVKMPHPKGFVEAEFTSDGREVHGQVHLPDGVSELREVGDFIFEVPH